MNMTPEVRDKLPVHPGQRHSEPFVLRIDGLVSKTLELTTTDLDRLPQQDLKDDFTCLEGWTVPALNWRGVALQVVLDLVGAPPETQWVQASSGNFSVPVSIDEARRALLATHLGDEPLPPEHGGPLRLVVPGGDCFASIKWLDHLEVCLEAGQNTGKEIALGRLRSSPPSSS
jgi:DMSO/TMAO reductase YedYZ molybdopterin-dependent catalytic subunit